MSTKNVINTVTGFINHYGSEVLGIAKALDAVMNSLSLMPVERKAVKDVIDQLENAAKNISNSPAPAKVVINKKDIEAAVSNVLPSILEKMVNDAVSKAVENVVKYKDNSDENA